MSEVLPVTDSPVRAAVRVETRHGKNGDWRLDSTHYDLRRAEGWARVLIRGYNETRVRIVQDDKVVWRYEMEGS